MFIHLITILLAQSMFAGLPVDGISCDRMEGAVEHIHTQLTLVERGRSVSVPANIGISESAGCLYWLHTHSDDGLIHIEAPVRRTFTLGQFFDIWGKTLNRTQADGVRGHLTITVNGRRWTADPRSIPLRDHEEIAIRGS